MFRGLFYLYAQTDHRLCGPGPSTPTTADRGQLSRSIAAVPWVHRRELRNEAPPVAVILPDHVKARDAHVQPHRLEPYDQLKEQGDE